MGVVARLRPAVARHGTLRNTAAAAIAATCLLATPGESSAAPTRVLHLRLTGVINPIKSRYIARALAGTRAEGVSLVLLSIDTPGGLVSSMQDIVEAITASRVPVVALVEPRAAQATSAGALILLASDVAAMLSDTRMGAAHPVGAGEPLKGALEQKATNSLASLAKSLASRRGRSASAAEEMVRSSTSYTASEAATADLVELVVGSRAQLFARLDGRVLDFTDRKAVLHTRNVQLVERPLTPSERLLDGMADPTVASILLTIGVLGIIYELSAPGIGLGGIVGVSALLLGLLGMSVLPLRLAGVLLMTAGVLSIALEVKTPAHGLLGVGGAAAMLLGALVLVDERSYFGAAQQVRWLIFAPIDAAVVVACLALAAVARRTLRAPPQSGVEALRGATGIAKTAFRHRAERCSGDVMVDGARWSAVSEVEIAEGAEVEVEQVLHHPMRLKVKPRPRG